jgi:hypothetical protein
MKIYHSGSKLLFDLLPGKSAKNSSIEETYRLNGRLRAQKHCYYSYSKKCELCSVMDICDGFHSDYSLFFGTDEAVPIRHLPKISDPKYYINNQLKVVEQEDFDWAL